MTNLDKLQLLWLSEPSLAIQMSSAVPEFQYSDFDINLILKQTKAHGFNDETLRARVQTKSGKFEFSIVGDKYSYSTPRVNGGPFTEVELAIFCTETGNWALPSQILNLLRKYNFPEGEYSYQVDENDNPSDEDFHSAVFGYVPITQVIEMLIKL